ncbi:MAG: ornithine cyclodeaminase, partial [Chloroflexota bacterium]|nr:ornithine cyclodeaminase [Chloroflexota bacterium]
RGYIPFHWLQPGALLVNVSLDDVLPDVVMKAGKVVVDDWRLVKTDSRRLLGRMYRQGLVVGPGEARRRGARAIHAELGQLVLGSAPGRTSHQEVVLLNPFGLSIEDIAVASRVYESAVRMGLGLELEP